MYLVYYSWGSDDMADRLFYIDGSWLTYEQAHNLGYTLFPPKILTLYTQSNSEVQIRQDITDKKYYDSLNQRWVDDFYTLHLYCYINNVTCYKGESRDEYRGYSNHSNDRSIKYILYDSFITDLQSLYYSKGITTYKCNNVIVDGNNRPVVWYDSSTNKYFDDRDGIHQWVDHIDDSPVIMYDSSENQSKKIYENEITDSFFTDDTFISRDNFYSYDNYGIIRDLAYTFLEPSVYGTYYDTYSDEYCIPNVTPVWMSRDDILGLGHIFIEGIADMWLCQEPLYLPWKYLPTTVTLTFTNSLHQELSIILPEAIEVSTGGEVILPQVTGVYEDNSSIRWRAARWDIGEFNSSVELNENTDTDIICEKLKATLSFTNSYYQSLNIPLPESIVVDNGDPVTLPIIEGEYEDAGGIKYTPYAWDIGAFNSEYILKTDTVANVLCEKMKVKLTFSNSIHPELDIQLPNEITRYHNDTVLLPRVRGVHYDNDSIGWIPMKWDLGQFDSLILLDGDKVATLIWEPLSESISVALCGSMPNDSGASTEASVSLVLSADGSMMADEFVYSNKSFTHSCEIFGDRLKIWDSSYTAIVVPEFDKNSYTTSDQMLCGTIRSWGIYGNSYVDFSESDGSFCKDDPVYNKKYFTYNCEVFGDKLEVWNSSFEPVIPVFPQKDSESSTQMITGTIRSWGSYANRGIELNTASFTDTMNALPIKYNGLYFIEHVEVFGDTLKVYDKPPYTPIIPVFPDKSGTESDSQMICGTLRISGNKANRGISIEDTFGRF